MDISQQIDFFISQLASLNVMQAAFFTLFFLSVWFLPTLVALIFNRSSVKLIFLANVPAVLSWIVWFGLLAWAATGKVSAQLADKIKAEKSKA